MGSIPGASQIVAEQKYIQKFMEDFYEKNVNKGKFQFKDSLTLVSVPGSEGARANSIKASPEELRQQKVNAAKSDALKVISEQLTKQKQLNDQLNAAVTVEGKIAKIAKEWGANVQQVKQALGSDFAKAASQNVAMLTKNFQQLNELQRKTLVEQETAKRAAINGEQEKAAYILQAQKINKQFPGLNITPEDLQQNRQKLEITADDRLFNSAVTQGRANVNTRSLRNPPNLESGKGSRSPFTT